MMRDRGMFPRFTTFVILFGAAVLAQTESRLTGTLMDSSGSLIVGAQVTATNSSTGVATHATSNETGTYVFPALQPGSYVVTAHMPGFKRFEQPAVVLDTGFVRTLDIQLAIGDVNEVVR